jgi:hypothetical protein
MPPAQAHGVLIGARRFPPDSAAESLLAASIQKAATEQASRVGSTLELAKAISGKSCRLSENDLQVKAVSLSLVDPHLAFEGKKVDVDFERTGGAKAVLHGEADE